MSNNLNDITADLLSAAKSKGYDTNQINSVIGSPDGQALMAQLNGPGGQALKAAAANAAKGDTGALSGLLNTLMSTKEGRNVAKQVMGMKKD